MKKQHNQWIRIENEQLRTNLKIATTAAANRYATGGRVKEARAPRPITLPKLKCLEAAE